MGKSAFIDELEIAVESGDGGDGIVSFCVNGHVPKVGPTAATAGKGGDVFMRADGRLNTLVNASAAAKNQIPKRRSRHGEKPPRRRR